MICPVNTDSDEEYRNTHFLHNSETIETDRIGVEILLCEGSCVPSKLLQMKLGLTRAWGVLDAMNSLHKDRDDPKYVGEHMCLQGNVHVFYKCPPGMVSKQALKARGIDPDVYEERYNQSPSQHILMRVFRSQEILERYMDRVIRGTPIYVKSLDSQQH